MANADRPNGFTFVRSLGGNTTPVIRVVGVADGADIMVGDAVKLSSGLAAKATVEAAILGVAVGFGKKDAASRMVSGGFNPDDLTKRFYDDSANTHTDWVCFYIPAEDSIFAAQCDSAGGAVELVVGEAQDLIDGGGSETTGISQMEINDDALTNDGDVVVVEKPVIPDNDYTLANAVYHVKFVNTQFDNA